MNLPRVGCWSVLRLFLGVSRLGSIWPAAGQTLTVRVTVDSLLVNPNSQSGSTHLGSTDSASSQKVSFFSLSLRMLIGLTFRIGRMDHARLKLFYNRVHLFTSAAGLHGCNGIMEF